MEKKGGREVAGMVARGEVVVGGWNTLGDATLLANLDTLASLQGVQRGELLEQLFKVRVLFHLLLLLLIPFYSFSYSHSYSHS